MSSLLYIQIVLYKWRLTIFHVFLRNYTSWDMNVHTYYENTIRFICSKKYKFQ